ncbi:hypothetical protein HYN59_07220 [Flavobacterium album]|uniref:Uncharacterized protein n=1 Tax=Flavobacterium album TaxID=2175091 RepID=A0A2S1QX56_9FLAO|nr:hypothetical protein [Flavobacterium album]AWH84929.1 hypothetical protein HYN59_07220 [Flavobacterium album]
MIAETIKMLQSGQWYGCGHTIEIAKGKNAIPGTWKETKEKIRRIRYMQATEMQKENIQKSKKMISWLKSMK